MLPVVHAHVFVQQFGMQRSINGRIVDHSQALHQQSFIYWVSYCEIWCCFTQSCMDAANDAAGLGGDEKAGPLGKVWIQILLPPDNANPVL